MFKYTKKEILFESKKRDFITNTYEKVLRLCDILEYISKSSFGDKLALKGGTAINLWLLNLPRLSVDADFDFCCNISKEEMLVERENIKNKILKFMEMEGYILNSRSKYTHSLDSLVFGYNTLSGSNDVLKIEINYSNRIHVTNPIKSVLSLDICNNFTINRLSNEELIGSKINALIMRTTPRDVYDTYNLIKDFRYDKILIKKIAIFYAILSSDIPVDFKETLENAKSKMRLMNYNRIRETLIPMLNKSEKIVIEDITKIVIEFIDELFTLNDNEQRYIDEFNKGNINPELLFEEYKINDIKNHPMVLWKIMNNNK